MTLKLKASGKFDELVKHIVKIGRREAAKGKLLLIGHRGGVGGESTYWAEKSGY